MATLTDVSIEYSAKNLIGFNPYSPFQYLALGSGTDEEYYDSSELTAEHTSNGLERALATIEYIDPFKIQWSHMFLATGSTTISEAGIFNAEVSNDGDMFLRHVLPAPLSVYDGDEIEVIFTHIII